MRKGNWRRGMAALGAAAALLWAAGCGGGGKASLERTATAVATPVASGTTGSETAAPTRTPVVPPEVREASAALREGRYEEARDMYVAIAERGGDPSVVASAWMGAGVAAGEAGDAERGYGYLRSAMGHRGAEAGVVRRAAYLLGRRLNDEGAAEAARDVLLSVEEEWDDVLQPYIAAEVGRALAELGESVAAEAAWDEALLSPLASDPLKADVYRARAEMALSLGETGEALGWLEKLVEVAAAPETRYQLATLAGSAGDTELFEEQLHAIVISEPASDFAVLAIDDLRAAGVPVDAGKEGYVHYRRRSFAAARAVLGAGVEEGGLDAGELAFRTYYLAASYEDGGFPAEAVPLYDRVPLIDPSSPYAHRAKYWAARATENMGNLEEASARYLAVVTEGIAGEFVAESGFRAGYVSLQSGMASQALDFWDLVGVEKDGRFLYWVARARALSGDAPGAREAFAAAQAADPFGLYGEEAGRALGEVGPLDVGFAAIGEIPEIDWQEIVEWVAGPGAGAPEALVTAAAGLVEIGLRAEARAILDAEGRGLAGEALLPVLREAHESGLSEVGARLAVRLIAERTSQPWEAPESLLRLAYPVDYSVRLEAVAKGAEVDPLFLAALVRQESFWDPAAVSIAGAIGLTQVMPATGEGIAATIGPDPWGPEDLVRPGISLAFGAYYLGAQVKRFGSGYVALAAYNAGPGNAQEWAAGSEGGAIADFVEEVDIAETKHYVEQVLSHYAYYRMLYR